MRGPTKAFKLAVVMGFTILIGVIGVVAVAARLAGERRAEPARVKARR